MDVLTLTRPMPAMVTLASDRSVTSWMVDRRADSEAVKPQARPPYPSAHLVRHRHSTATTTCRVTRARGASQPVAY